MNDQDYGHFSADLHTLRLTQIADATPDSIVSINGEQLIEYANPAALTLFGCSESDMIGSRLDRFIPAQFRGAHGQLVREFGRAGISARQMARHRPISALKADGTEFPVEASISHGQIDGEHVYTVILRDISERVEAQRELEHAQARLRQLSNRLQQVREQEHRRLSRELHDDIGQRLSVVKMDVARIKTELSENHPALFDDLDRADEMLSETVTAVRGLATGLRPKILDDLGLTAALDHYLQEVSNRFPLDCQLRVDDDLPVSQDGGIMIFRIVQEAVHNTCKYANASTCEVELLQDSEGLTLTIYDNGSGLAPGDEDKDGSLGLMGIRERVAGVGGKMSLQSAPGDGTRITCQFPLVIMRPQDEPSD